MGAALDVFSAAACIVAWFLPWHVPGLRWGRLRWTDRVGRLLATGCVAIVAFVPASVVLHDWPGVVRAALMSGSAGYALWRAWREHRPPRRPLRDRASAAVRVLVERMQPARVPAYAGGGAR